MLKKLIYLFIPLLMLVGCGTKKAIYSGSAEELYREAVAELEKEGGGFLGIFGGTNYEKIFELLKEIQLRYPLTPYATLARIRVADAYFKKEEYTQAIIEYEEFLKRYPGHPETKHAMYYLALSYYKLRKSHDRDPTYTRKAIEVFENYKKLFPNAENIEEVNKKTRKCKDILAKREIYIGKFYLKRKNYKAAYERFKNVVKNYPESKYYDDAMKLMEEIKEKVEEEESFIGRLI